MYTCILSILKQRKLQKLITNYILIGWFANLRFG